MPRSVPLSVLYLTDSRRGRLTARARGALYRDFFERDGWRFGLVDVVTADEDALAEAARAYDVVMLLKVASYSLVRKLRGRTRARLVFDLTDSLWTPAYRRAGWRDLERILRAVDAVVCENEYVRAYGLRYNPDVRVLPTCAQVELFDVARDAMREEARAPRRSDRVVIGWVGSRGTTGALDKIAGPLRRLSARHPELELRVLGADPTAAARVLAGIRYSLVPEYGEADMVREMLALDIGVFPVPVDVADYRARGPLKALLYMAAGVPAVCQHEGDCARILQDGVTGMLARSEEEWEAKLEALVVSPELRRRMGAAALARARAGHTLAQTYAAIRDTLATVPFSRRRAPFAVRAADALKSGAIGAAVGLFRLRRKLGLAGSRA